MHQENTKIKYFVYCRKSSENEDRQMASIESQDSELTKLAKQNNLEIVEVLSEAKSAKAPGRPVFSDMIKRIKNGEANGIICWKLNRLARNPIDGGEIQWLLQKGTIQHIQTFGKSYFPNDNVLLMSVELGMANQYIRDLSVDSKRGLRTKAERGWYPAYTTIGYMNNPYKVKDGKEIIKDPERFDLVRKMFDLMLTGCYNPPQLLNIANDEWKLTTKAGRKLARSTVYRILNDTFYYGDFEYPKDSGNWYHGKHEPMITSEEYQKIQGLLKRKGNVRPQKHLFPFTGMIRCKECGAMIVAENKIKKQKNGNVHFYTYYHCSKRKNQKCTQKTIRVEKLEEQIIERLEAIQIPEDFKEWAMNAIRKENNKEFEGKKTIIDSQQKSYNACINKLNNLIDMRANNEITEKEFLDKKSEINKEKEALSSLLRESDKGIDDWIEKAEQLFTFAETAKFRFENGGLIEKKEILFTLGSNLLLKDGELFIDIQKPLQAIEKASSEIKRINKRLEPVKNGLDKRKMGEIYSHNPTMLRW